MSLSLITQIHLVMVLRKASRLFDDSGINVLFKAPFMISIRLEMGDIQPDRDTGSAVCTVGHIDFIATSTKPLFDKLGIELRGKAE
jgi:hypothetical protein